MGPAGGGGLLPGALPGAGGLRRSSSWSGGLGLSPRIGGQSPRVVPVPVPVPVASPHIGRYGGLRSRTPSPCRLVLSPRIGARTPSPRVANYNTFNVSPRLRGLDGVSGGYGGVGGLGALDDLHLGGGTPVIDPVVLSDGGYDGGMFGGGGTMPGLLSTHHHHDFVVTDLDHAPGRAIVQDLGIVEGLSGMDAYLSEDDKLSLAIGNLTANAQSLGANAVLQVETGEDVGGQILVRGRAAVLS
ncbi:glutaredoxin [Rhodotorula toruloides]|uniref:Glutaredoxin n=1 Tax=Rhodotorula toruloides TaxID=5286 RepID=A0A511KPA7_RHOTO|nr:glutaredoxin [Rhodotorula toruloides]